MTNEPTAPVVTWSRHRMFVDGVGVTTLVIFHGCPLRCRYCLNPYTTESTTPTIAMTPQELFDAVRCDALYFEATGGGVTFGGGEPLLYAAFIRRFRTLCPTWQLNAETSLAVPWKQVETVAAAVDHVLVDCKDTDSVIYRRYTEQENARMLDNLERLLRLIGPDRITVRLPLIPDFNTPDDVDRSEARLRAMGVTRFDRFSYQIR